MARTQQTPRSCVIGGLTRPQSKPPHLMSDSDNDDDDTPVAEQKGEGNVGTEPIVQGSTNEIKYLEKRYGKNGRTFIREFVDDDDPVDDNSAWFERFVLCVTLHMDSQNKYIAYKSLAVHSRYLKTLLNDVIGNEYPGVSYSTKNISVNLPVKSLFHYRKELEQEASTRFIDNPEATSHAKLLLDFVKEEFKDSIEESENLVEQGKITYEHLWTIMRPGTTVVSSSLAHPRAYKLTNTQYVCGLTPHFAINVTHTDFDGLNFGSVNATLEVYPWRGVDSISNLNVLPLSFHPEEAAITSRLVQRGRKFESLAGQHLRSYTGVAISLDPLEGRISVNGRVMIDTKTTHRKVTKASFTVSQQPSDDAVAARRRRIANGTTKAKSLDADAPPELVPLTDAQALTANALVPGFCFTNKKFLYFAVDLIADVVWNTRCFDQLVLPDTHKSTVQALVSMHTKRAASASFDDIVKGKGRGLVLVLHGPPGVGKTLTAECVAEYAHRPLYIVSSGDLGTNSQTLDTRLTETLDLASTFKAVLLIDEADVFLSRRTLHDLERNALVSIFLRTLEYYEGILFLTSNRIRDFDDAFKSRIHIPLKYTDLPPASRKAIWRNFLTSTEAGGASTSAIDEKGFDRLAQFPLNGRQIKNVVRTAVSLADHRGQALDLAQVEMVLGIQMEFEREMASGSALYAANGSNDDNYDIMDRNWAGKTEGGTMAAGGHLTGSNGVNGL